MDPLNHLPLRIEPWDLLRCAGCDQLLQADGRGRFPEAAIAACQGRCDWVLLAGGHSSD